LLFHERTDFRHALLRLSCEAWTNQSNLSPAFGRDTFIAWLRLDEITIAIKSCKAVRRTSVAMQRPASVSSAMATSGLAPLATIVDAEPKGQQLLQFEQGLSPDD
jgi:hypothetical protein